MTNLDEVIQVFKPAVIEALEQLKTERRSAVVCEKQLGGLDPSRMSEIRKGRRELSYYYFAWFARGGIFTVKQLMGGKRLEDFTPEQREILKSLELEPRIAAKVQTAISQGIDVETIIDALLQQASKK